MRQLLSKTSTTKKEYYQVFDHREDVSICVVTENDVFTNAYFMNPIDYKFIPGFVKKNFLEKIRTSNPFHHDWREIHCLILDQNWKSKKFKEEDLFFFYQYGHVLFDKDMRPEPIFTSFDYIGTPFSNDYSYLEPMMTHLKTHPWVVNKENLEIREIPYYNKYDNHTHYIQVDILPDKETLEQIYDKYKNNTEICSSKIKEVLYGGPPWEENSDIPDYLDIKQFRKKVRE